MAYLRNLPQDLQDQGSSAATATGRGRGNQDWGSSRLVSQWKQRQSCPPQWQWSSRSPNTTCKIAGRYLAVHLDLWWSKENGVMLYCIWVYVCGWKWCWIPYFKLVTVSITNSAVAMVVAMVVAAWMVMFKALQPSILVGIGLLVICPYALAIWCPMPIQNRKIKLTTPPTKAP